MQVVLYDLMYNNGLKRAASKRIEMAEEEQCYIHTARVISTNLRRRN